MCFPYLSSIILSFLQHTRISLPFYEAGDDKALEMALQRNPGRKEFGLGLDLGELGKCEQTSAGNHLSCTPSIVSPICYMAASVTISGGSDEKALVMCLHRSSLSSATKFT